MVEIVQPKFFIETAPIRVTDKPEGGKKTDIHSLSLRVTDSYTRMPIGSVLHGPLGDGRFGYRAHGFFRGEGSNELPAPEGGWGPRFDMAARAVWSDYIKGLPLGERARRWAWRWIGVGWLLIGTIWGVLIAVIAEALRGQGAC